MDLRYPIGKYEPQPFSSNQKRLWLQDIQFLPGLLENAIENLDEPQLRTPYRDGGWTVKQVVHHVADSHMNAYIRFKLGLTEDNPTIKPYEEARWAGTQRCGGSSHQYEHHITLHAAYTLACSHPSSYRPGVATYSVPS